MIHNYRFNFYVYDQITLTVECKFSVFSFDYMKEKSILFSVVFFRVRKLNKNHRIL